MSGRNKDMYKNLEKKLCKDKARKEAKRIIDFAKKNNIPLRKKKKA